jgi:hypothetical protein
VVHHVPHTPAAVGAIGARNQLRAGLDSVVVSSRIIVDRPSSSGFPIALAGLTMAARCMMAMLLAPLSVSAFLGGALRAPVATRVMSTARASTVRMMAGATTEVRSTHHLTHQKCTLQRGSTLHKRPSSVPSRSLSRPRS